MAPPIPPAGSTPASTWVAQPGTGNPSPPALLADNIDPATGELVSLMTSPHPVDAAIAEAFRIRAGSGPALGLAGHRFNAIRKKGDSVEREIRDEATRIMKPFVDRGDVRFDALLTDVENASQGSDGAAALVRYTNLLTAEPQEVKIR